MSFAQRTPDDVTAEGPHDDTSVAVRARGWGREDYVARSCIFGGDFPPSVALPTGTLSAWEPFWPPQRLADLKEAETFWCTSAPGPESISFSAAPAGDRGPIFYQLKTLAPLGPSLVNRGRSSRKWSDRPLVDVLLRIFSRSPEDDTLSSFMSCKAIFVAEAVDAPKDSEDRLNQLLDKWLADDSGYDEQVWPQLMKGLDNSRLSSRKLFPDE